MDSDDDWENACDDVIEQKEEVKVVKPEDEDAVDSEEEELKRAVEAKKAKEENKTAIRAKTGKKDYD
jgi:hypothetical protein